MSADEGSAGYDFKLYRYTPSLAGAVIAMLLFATVTSLHIWKLVRHRALYFTAFAIGGICTHYNPSEPQRSCPANKSLVVSRDDRIRRTDLVELQ